MPGKGCLARKAERKEQRRRLIAAEAAAEAETNGEPATKMARIGEDDDPDLAKIAAELGVDSPAPAPLKIWAEVPPMEDLSDEDREKAIALCRALYEACLGFGQEGCTVPQLGSHYKVQQLKKDPCFNRQRLVDILRRHEDVFELTTTEGGGHQVHLQPGAMAACPGEAPIAPPMLSCESLPPLLENIETAEERFQALRINVVHSLFKRGGKAVLHDLGQDPKIVELRKQILNGRSLLQFIKVFPFNFGIEDMGNGNFTIDLSSLDVSETSMIKDAAEEFATEFVRGLKGTGKGKGGKNDGRCKFAVNPMLVMAMKGKFQEMKGGKGQEEGEMQEWSNGGKGKEKGEMQEWSKGGKGKEKASPSSSMAAAAASPMMMMQMFMKGKAMGKGIFGGGSWSQSGWDSSSWGGGGSSSSWPGGSGKGSGRGGVWSGDEGSGSSSGGW